MEVEHHSARASLGRLAVGQRVHVGEVVGEIGPHPENGDWPAHLHLQLIVDMLVSPWNGRCPVASS